MGHGLKRQEDSIVSGTPEQKDIDITGRITLTPNEDHDIQLELGTTRLRRDSTVGNTTASGSDAYNYNDRDHWSISHIGRWGPTTSEFSFQQEWAERTNFNWDGKTKSYVENLRSPHIRNSVLDGKFTTPFEFHGNHTLVTGGQFMQSVLTDQNPGRRTGLDEEFSVRQWALLPRMNGGSHPISPSPAVCVWTIMKFMARTSALAAMPSGTPPNN